MAPRLANALSTTQSRRASSDPTFSTRQASYTIAPSSAPTSEESLVTSACMRMAGETVAAWGPSSAISLTECLVS